MKDLSQIVLEMLASLDSVNRQKDRLIEITADNLEDFICIQEALERIPIGLAALFGRLSLICWNETEHVRVK